MAPPLAGLGPGFADAWAYSAAVSLVSAFPKLPPPAPLRAPPFPLPEEQRWAAAAIESATERACAADSAASEAAQAAQLRRSSAGGDDGGEDTPRSASLLAADAASPGSGDAEREDSRRRAADLQWHRARGDAHAMARWRLVRHPADAAHAPADLLVV